MNDINLIMLLFVFFIAGIFFALFDCVDKRIMKNQKVKRTIGSLPGIKDKESL